MAIEHPDWQVMCLVCVRSVEFPVGQETLTRLILENEIESDIFKVSAINLFLLFPHYFMVSPGWGKPEYSIYAVNTILHIKWNDFVSELSLSGNSASCFADDCRIVADARERRLRSTESRTCVVTQIHSTFGDSFCSCQSRVMEQFTATSRRCWPDLPYIWFQRSLKTFLSG